MNPEEPNNESSNSDFMNEIVKKMLEISVESLKPLNRKYQSRKNIDITKESIMDLVDSYFSNVFKKQEYAKVRKEFESVLYGILLVSYKEGK